MAVVTSDFTKSSEAIRVPQLAAALAPLDGSTEPNDNLVPVETAAV